MQAARAFLSPGDSGGGSSGYNGYRVCLLAFNIVQDVCFRLPRSPRRFGSFLFPPRFLLSPGLIPVWPIDVDTVRVLRSFEGAADRDGQVNNMGLKVWRGSLVGPMRLFLVITRTSFTKHCKRDEWLLWTKQIQNWPSEVTMTRPQRI